MYLTRAPGKAQPASTRLSFKIGLVFFLFGWTAFTCSYAQIDSLLNADVTLEDLLNLQVTSASRKSERVDDAPANITVISREMIDRRGYYSLYDLLRDQPGFDFSTDQPSGEYPAHFHFRGIGDLGQAKVILMVDGIVQNDISNGWIRNVGFDFSFNDVDRVEIVTGPGSALYGANAYAGVIHVITKQGDENFPPRSGQQTHVDARLMGGQYGTFAPELFLAHRTRSGLQVQLSGRFYGSKGDMGLNRPDPGNYFHNNFEPDSVLTTEHGVIANERNPDGSRKAIPDGFNTSINDLYLRGRIAKDGFALAFNFWDRNEGLGSEVPGYEYFANTEGIDYRAHHNGFSIIGVYDTELDDRVNSTSRVYFRNTSVRPGTGFVYTYQYQSVNNGVDSAVVDKKKAYSGDGYVVGLDQQMNFELADRNLLIAGVQLEHYIKQYWGISLGPEQDISSTNVGSTFPNELPSVQPVYFARNFAFYAQDEHRFDDRYHLTAGVRIDVGNQFGNSINPRLGFVRKGKGINFKLLYGQAYKIPTVFELFDEWRGNENLEPEKINTGEVEIGYTFKKSARIRANIFYNSLQDLILEAPNPDTSDVPLGPSGQKATYFQNSGSSSIAGFSVRGDLELFRHLLAYANYTFTADGNGEALTGVAQHKVNFGFNYLLKNKLNINVRANWVGKTLAPASNAYFYPKDANTIAAVGYDYVTETDPDGFLEGHFKFDMVLTGKNLFNKDWTIEPQIIVRNVLDTQYLFLGRQSGSGLRPVDAQQPLIQNPNGFIPAYHPAPGRQILASLRYRF